MSALAMMEQITKKNMEAQRIARARALAKATAMSSQGRVCSSGSGGSLKNMTLKDLLHGINLETWEEDLTISISSDNADVSVWSDRQKAEATQYLADEIKAQQQKKKEMETLIEHTKRLVTARINAQNEIGVMLSTKQLNKYEAQRELSSQSIKDLEHLFFKVSSSDEPVPYVVKVKEILSRPAPEVVNDDIVQLSKEKGFHFADASVAMLPEDNFIEI